MAPSPPDTLRRFLDRTTKLVLSAMFISALFRMFIFAPYVIPSQSMMPGLITGDWIVVSKLDYGLSSYNFSSRFKFFNGTAFAKLPERGDVVVFAGVRQPRLTFIKRVVGLPGDLIEMRNGRLIVNGKKASQVFVSDFILPLGPSVDCLVLPGIIDLRIPMVNGIGCRWFKYIEALDGKTHHVLDFAVSKSDTFKPARVPPGHLFMMGDNRDDSLDSRFPVSQGGLGMVPVDRLLGKARYIVYSSDGSASIFNPFSWWQAARSERISQII